MNETKKQNNDRMNFIDRITEEARQIIELSSIKIRTRYQRFGYYGYDFKKKRLVDPMWDFEITNARLSDITTTIYNSTDKLTMLLNNDNEVIVFRLSSFQWAKSMLSLQLQRLYEKNVVVVMKPSTPIESNPYGEIELNYEVLSGNKKEVYFYVDGRVERVD